MWSYAFGRHPTARTSRYLSICLAVFLLVAYSGKVFTAVQCASASGGGGLHLALTVHRGRSGTQSVGDLRTHAYETSHLVLFNNVTQIGADQQTTAIIGRDDDGGCVDENYHTKKPRNEVRRTHRPRRRHGGRDATMANSVAGAGCGVLG